MSGRLTSQDHGAAELLARALELSGGRRVRVGILADAPKTEHDGGDGAATLLEIAAIHEFGAGPIPQRSFIRATIDQRKADIAKLQGVLAGQVLAGKLTPDQALTQLGAKVASWMQQRIASGIAPALDPATVAAKGSSVPLVDTGQLKASITFLVEGA